MFHFYNPWFSGAIEMEHWVKMSESVIDSAVSYAETHNFR